jgi:hypothetical protein
MVYFGRVKDGKVEFDATPALPEGMAVRVEPVEAAASKSCTVDVVQVPCDPLDGLGLETADFGPPDLSLQHDHYIYGTGKRSQPEG